MSEENTTQAPGLVLPDDAAMADRVTATDRLLSFDAAGNPVTATAEQVKTYAASGLATTQAMTAALGRKANLIPESLAEQLVTGEFWDGKQVYVRTFVGTTPEARVISIMTGIREAHLVNGYIFNIDNYKIPAGLYNGVGADFWSYATSPSNLLTIESIGEKLHNKPYKFTIKYTKA